MKERLNDLELKKGRSFKQLLKKKFSNFLTIIIYLIVPMIALFLISLLSIALENKPAFKISIYGLIVLIFVFLLVVVEWLSSKIGRPRYKSINLYNWLDNLEGFEEYMKELLDEIKTESLRNNLKLTKEKIMEEFNGDKKELMLFKAYLEALGNDEIFQTYGKLIMTIVGGSIVGAVVSYFRTFSEQGGQAYLNSKLQFSKLDNIDLIYIFFVVFIILAFIVLGFYKNKNRINITREIVSVCIEELKELEEKEHKDK